MEPNSRLSERLVHKSSQHYTHYFANNYHRTLEPTDFNLYQMVLRLALSYISCMPQVPDIELKLLIAKQKKLYLKLLPVFSPALRKDVNFSMAGFRHLHTDGRGHYRGTRDAKTRLSLLEYAPNVISQARMVKTDIKSTDETSSGKKETYYELYCKVGIVHRRTVVVTVRVIGNGDPHFYGMRYVGKKKKTA